MKQDKRRIKKENEKVKAKQLKGELWRKGKTRNEAGDDRTGGLAYITAQNNRLTK